MTMTELAKLAGVSHCAVMTLIKAFKERNGDVRDLRSIGGYQLKVIPAGVEEFAIRKETLKLTAHMNLSLKCEYIQEKTGHKFVGH